MAEGLQLPVLYSYSNIPSPSTHNPLPHVLFHSSHPLSLWSPCHSLLIKVQQEGNWIFRFADMNIVDIPRQWERFFLRLREWTTQEGVSDKYWEHYNEYLPILTHIDVDSVAICVKLPKLVTVLYSHVVNAEQEVMNSFFTSWRANPSAFTTFLLSVSSRPPTPLPLLCLICTISIWHRSKLCNRNMCILPYSNSVYSDGILQSYYRNGKGKPSCFPCVS